MRNFVLVLMALSFVGCGKIENGQPIPVATKTATTKSTEPEATLKFTIDGLLNDWAGAQPVWREAGKIGFGRFAGIDIKQVMMQNDENYLYIFLQCTPSVSEKMENAETSGALCDIYFDTDNDPATGCSEVNGFDYGKINGYEYKLWVPLGIAFGGEESFFVSYDLISPDKKGKFTLDEVASASSNSSDFIKHGNDGVEICLPIDKLNLKGKSVRLLLQESTDPYATECYSEGRYSIN